jgi:hypothetical protein
LQLLAVLPAKKYHHRYYFLQLSAILDAQALVVLMLWLALFSILDEAPGVTSIGGIDLALLDCLPLGAMATLLLLLFA